MCHLAAPGTEKQKEITSIQLKQMNGSSGAAQETDSGGVEGGMSENVVLKPDIQLLTLSCYALSLQHLP